MYLKKVSIIIISSLALFSCSTTSNNDLYNNLSEQQIYKRGKDNLDGKKYAKAINDFEALQARYPYGELAEKSQVALVYSYYQRNDYALALSTIDHFLNIHPNHKDADYMQYMKGMIYYKENYSPIYEYLPLNRSERDNGKAEKSFFAFKKLLEKFPNSKYAKDASQRMIQLKEQIAQHELNIAKYYLNKKAYLAAANRAGNVVTEFNKTKAVPEALSTMANAYDKLGMTDMKDKAIKTLKDNY